MEVEQLGFKPPPFSEQCLRTPNECRRAVATLGSEEAYTIVSRHSGGSRVCAGQSRNSGRPWATGASWASWHCGGSGQGAASWASWHSRGSGHAATLSGAPQRRSKLAVSARPHEPPATCSVMQAGGTRLPRAGLLQIWATVFFPSRKPKHGQGFVPMRTATQVGKHILWRWLPFAILLRAHGCHLQVQQTHSQKADVLAGTALRAGHVLSFGSLE